MHTLAHDNGCKLTPDWAATVQRAHEALGRSSLSPMVKLVSRKLPLVLAARFCSGGEAKAAAATEGVEDDGALSVLDWSFTL